MKYRKKRISKGVYKVQYKPSLFSLWLDMKPLCVERRTRFTDAGADREIARLELADRMYRT